MTSFLKKIFSGDDKKKSAVTVVSGLPRSGTSMMMKMLEAGGIPPLTDKLRTADDDNPKGYYEFERVKQMDKGDTDWLAEAEGKVVKVISALLKHLPDDYDYRIIFLRRDMPEILASQKKMLVRRGEDPDKVPDEEMSAMFERHVRQTEQWLANQPNMNVIYVHYREVLNDPEPNARRINNFLDDQLDLEAMVAQVDPDLYRNRAPAGGTP